ncbi:hypothetical protein [Streptomyces sp. NPDC007264]|uniref:hypothetical protein n=1 Tax=Streptomyces sp. NPDC007264 TaxID=3364777 RepID=UPI0036D8F884
MVVIDLGDVLVRTVADAQYAALAELTGVPALRWAAAADGTGLVAALEEGRIGFPAFAADLLSRAGAADPLPLADVEEAWNRVVDGLDDRVASAAAPLTRQGRLLLASNTSPPHFARIQRLLVAAGIDAPACLSYEIGHRKPDDAFFRALADTDARVGAGAVFIDDRAEHIAAARRHGLTAHHHRDPEATAAYLHSLAS